MIARLRAWLCPMCGHTLDAHSCLQYPDAAPVPGDFTACIECMSVMEFDLALRLALVPAHRVAAELAKNRDLRETLAAIRMSHLALGVPRERVGRRH
jgi:hypothetical protein